MRKNEDSVFKGKVLAMCIDSIRERMAVLEKLMENAQFAANDEEKSSAGDKYETSRAMSHIEKDMYARQLAVIRNELARLMKINYTSVNATVTAGSMVVCRDKHFFIAGGIGKLIVDGSEVYVLSPGAPIAQKLIGKKAGDTLVFNKQEFKILSVI